MLYTRRQCDRIRASVAEYFDRHHFGPRKMTWNGLGDEIVDVTNSKVRDEVLRQWVKQFVQKGRKEPLKPNDEELHTLVDFLMSADVDMLTVDELQDPEPPRFLYSFVEFLHGGQAFVLPQTALDGAYEAWHLAERDDEEEKWIKTNILLEVSREEKFIRATENMEIHFRRNRKTDVLGGDQPSEGWGVVAPDGNLFLFMRTRPFTGNYYYLTIAVYPQLSTKSKVRQLALLRHERPAKCDVSTKTLEALFEETNGRTAVLNFIKVAALNKGSGD